MKPVTDPAILNQLNTETHGLKPVSDPALLSQLEGGAIGSETQKPLLNRVESGTWGDSTNKIFSGFKAIGDLVSYGIDNALSNIGKNFLPDSIDPVTGKVTKPADMHLSNPAVKNELIKGVSDYQAQKGSPIVTNIANAYERNFGIKAPLAAVGELATSPIDAFKYLYEQAPLAAVGGGIGGKALEGASLKVAENIALNEAKKKLIGTLATGAGFNAGATATGGAIPNIADAYSENKNIDQAISQGLKQTSAESGVAAAFGAPIGLGANTAKTVLAKSLGLEPADEVFQTLAGNAAIGKQTSGGEIVSSALLGGMGAPAEIAGVTLLKGNEQPQPQEPTTKAPNYDNIVSAINETQAQDKPLKFVPAEQVDNAEAAPQAQPAQTTEAQDNKILQNRDRSNPSSIAQMTSIAANPDYGRLSFSRDFANGAPVVSGGAISADQLGASDVAVASDGRRIPIQYAVVEAKDLLPSNNVDGSVNAAYDDDKVDAIRAIAGNGRVAGLQSAYANGTAANYLNEMSGDTLHGVDAQVIGRMNAPVLVRVMPKEFVTADIGDVSNTTGNLDLSSVEQANNDAKRVNLDGLTFAEDGSVTAQTVRQFVQAMPQAEQGSLIDTNGQPTRQAIDRINAAIFAKAYSNNSLVRLYAQAQDPEARLVLSALAQVAPKMARLEGAGALDIRPIVADAAQIAVNARRNGMTIAQAASQTDLNADPDVVAVLDLFAANPRSNKAVIEALGRAADFAYNEANKPSNDLLGSVERATRQDVINVLRGQHESTITQGMENQGGSQPANQDALRTATQRPGQDNAGSTQADRTEQTSQAAGEEGGLTLTGQTNQEINDGIAAREAAEKAKRDQEKADAEAKIEAERKARQGIAADSFELTHTGATAQETKENDAKQADNQFAGQQDIFSQPAKTQSQASATIEDFGEKIGGARKDMAGSTSPRQSKQDTGEDDDSPAWRKRFVVSENGMGIEGNTFSIIDKRTGKAMRQGWRVMEFETKEAAESAVPIAAVSQKHRVVADADDKFRIIRDVTDRKRVTIKDGFASREEAMRYMAENAAQILETKTGFGEELIVKPEKVYRNGEKHRSGNVNAKDFEKFGFRGVEFGNWNNQEERQEVMNHAYDGLMDLAALLNVKPKALSLNGELALAFGARGHGLSNARAHYERDYGVINLTKMSGAGSLAHEWWHALDHYLGRQDGKASKERVTNERGDKVFAAKGRGEDYVSAGFKNNSAVRFELRAAYEDLMNTMYRKAEQYVEDTEKAEKFVKATRDALDESLKNIRSNLEREINPIVKSRNNKPASEQQLAAFDELSDKLLNGEDLQTEFRQNEAQKNRRGLSGRWSNDTLDQIGAIFKAVRGRSGFTAERSGALDSVAAQMRRYRERIEMLKSARASDVKTKTVPTSYAMEAKKIDQGRTTDYWTSPHEMAARAFSSYVEDRIAEQENRSDFLSYGSDNRLYEIFGLRPFPEGAERKAINDAFNKFIAEIKTKETENGNVALFSRSQSTQQKYDQRIDELFNGGKANREGVKVLDKSDLLDMLGYGKLPVVLVESKVIAGQTNHNLTAEHWKNIPEWLSSPAAVFDSDTVPGSLVFIAPESYKGAPIRMIINPNVKENNIEVHLLANSYNAQLKAPTARWIREGLLRYIDKAKSREFLATSGLQLPRVLQEARSSGIRVYTDSNLVKYRSENSLDDGDKPSFKKGAFFSLGTGSILKLNKSESQVSARRLNAALAKYFKSQSWSNAFETVDVPDALSTFANEVKTAFGTDVRYVAPTSEKYNVFLGVQIPSIPNSVFVNATSQVNITTIAGHEIYHAIERSRPDLHAWFKSQAEKYLQNFNEYHDRLNSLTQDGEKKYSSEAAKTELLADFTGDAISDPDFLQQLANDDADKFSGLLKAVVNFISNAITKLKNLGSSKYISEVELLRDDLRKVLKAFNSGKDISEVLDDIPRFSRQSEVQDTNKENDKKRIFGRDAMGKVKLNHGEVAFHWLDKQMTPLLNAFNLHTATPELRRQLREMKTTIEEARRKSAKVAGEMQNMSQEERAMISDIVEGMLKPGFVPPEHALRVADAINQTMNQQTDELIELGMLSKETADRWRGKYLPRFYNRETELGLEETGGAMKGIKNAFVQGRPVTRGIGGGSLKGRGVYEEVAPKEVENFIKMGWEVRDDFWKYQQGKLEFVSENAPELARDSVTVWRDWTAQERQDMGEIRDSLYRFVLGYNRMQGDIALGRLFDNISKNQEWVRKNPSDGYVHVPDTTISGTNGVKRYGNLAGLWVRKDIFDHIAERAEEVPEALKIYREALGLWKEGKTALNPVAHFNNTVGNLTMAHIAGVSYWDYEAYGNALRDLLKGEDHPQVAEAIKAGLFTGSFTKEELANSLPPELKELVEKTDGKARKFGKGVMNFLSLWQRQRLSNVYEMEDQFFKYLIYSKAKEGGMNSQEAVDYALRYIFTYDDLPKGARAVRDTVLPFFAWTYKAIPALAHTLFVYPWRLAAPAVALYSINAIFYTMAAMDDDDDWLEAYRKGRELENAERSVLPDRMKGIGALLNQKTIRLGYDNETGNPVFLDASRLVPGGDLFDFTNQSGGIPMPGPLSPSHPILSTFAAMFANKDLWSGKEVVDRNDTSGEAAEKRTKWMFSQMLPAIGPGGYHSQRAMDAMADAAGMTFNFGIGEFTGIDKDGQPVQPGYTAMQTFGIKARPIDLEYEAEMRDVEAAGIGRSIQAETNALSRNVERGSISERRAQEMIDRAEEKIDRLGL